MFVSERGRRAGVVDNVVAHPVEDRNAPHLHAPADVLLEDLLDDGTHVRALVRHPGVVERLGEAALEDVAVELGHWAGVDLLPEEALHLAVPPEAERLHLQEHTGPNLSTGAGVENIALIGVFLSELTIYAPITAECSTPTRY